MGEKLSQMLDSNVLKGAAAAAAIGGVAVPAVEAKTVSPVESMHPAVHDHQLEQAQPGYRPPNRLLAFLRAESYRRRHRAHRQDRFTGYQVEGATSTFGWPTDDSGSRTADRGSTERPCIAIRNDATLDHRFQVTVLYHHIRHRATMIQCDWGPAADTGRSIDITGMGDERLGFSPYTYPTGAWGIARELKKVRPKPRRSKKRAIAVLNHPSAYAQEH